MESPSETLPTFKEVLKQADAIGNQVFKYTIMLVAAVGLSLISGITISILPDLTQNGMVLALPTVIIGLCLDIYCIVRLLSLMVAVGLYIFHYRTRKKKTP